MTPQLTAARAARAGRGTDLLLATAGFATALAFVLSQTYAPLRVNLTPVETYAAPVLGAFVLALSLRALLSPSKIPHLEAIALFAAGEIFVVIGFCAKLAAGGDNIQLATTYMMWVPALAAFGCLIIPHAVVLGVTWCVLAAFALATGSWLAFGQDMAGVTPVMLQSLMTGFLSLVAMLLLVREIAIRATLATSEQEAAKGVAEYANQTKTRFLARMSEDLRPALKLIIDFAEAIRNEVLGGYEAWPRYRDYAGEIAQSGTLLLSRVNDLLDSARIEAGTLMLAFRPVDPGVLVEESVASLHEAATRNGVSLINDVARETDIIMADPRALRKILDILLSNAVKFTPAGNDAGVRLTGTKTTVTLTIWDTGIGIDPADVPQPDGPFNATRRSTMAARPSLGLSLGLARSLVALHGGTLVFDGTLGTGTSVQVTLPVTPTREDATLA